MRRVKSMVFKMSKLCIHNTHAGAGSCSVTATIDMAGSGFTVEIRESSN